MHTIPQNVTSYEDKIVGIFVGRQFIYLAVGGLTAFILLSTGGGAAVIFRFILAIGVLGLAASMALLKVNDRGFDVWLYGYVKAVLGPTEWAWKKELSILAILSAPDRNLTAKQEASAAAPTVRPMADRERKEAFKSYLSGTSKDLDQDERQFLEALNFSEQVPHGTVSVSQSAPPPMLTPTHPLPAPVIQVQPVTILPTVSANEPVAALAQSTNKPSFNVSIGGEQRKVSMLNNQRANRSLSRQIMSGVALPVPVRGELRLDLAPAFQQELTNLIGFAPATSTAYTMLADAPQMPLAAPISPLPTPPTQTVPSPLIAAEPPTDDDQLAKMQAAADLRNNSLDQRRKLQIERPVAEQPAEVAVNIEEPVVSVSSVASPPAEHGPVEVDEEAQLRQQLATFEDLARRAQAQLDEERKARQVMEAEMQRQESNSAVLAQHYKDELARLQERSQETASQSQLAQQQLEALQQQAQVNPQAVDVTQVQQQQSLVDKLIQEEQRSASFARELISKMHRPEGVASAAPLMVAPQPQPVTMTSPEMAPKTDRALPTLTTQANVINGFVFDADGQFIDGAVVVIKDDSGEAKRALKSNKLGQFVVTTPLANGHYVVEADKKGLSLAILNIELTGQPVPALVIQVTKAT
jgi:hypothetical protein